MKIWTNSLFVFLYSSFAYAQDIGLKTGKQTIFSEHLLNWSLSLIVVLGLFFLALWLMKKTGMLATPDKQVIKVVGGLSLGVREKLVLVQVGHKQLLLGVTPGRISNLLVLDADQQLISEQVKEQASDDFASKLKQLMTGSSNE